MSNLAQIIIVCIVVIGLLSVSFMAIVFVIDNIIEIKHKKEEWDRERDLREWGRKR